MVCRCCGVVDYLGGQCLLPAGCLLSCIMRSRSCFGMRKKFDQSSSGGWTGELPFLLYLLALCVGIVWIVWISCCLRGYVFVGWTVYVVVFQCLLCLSGNSGFIAGNVFASESEKMYGGLEHVGMFGAEEFIQDSWDWCALDDCPRGSLGIFLGGRAKFCEVL